MLKNEIIHMLVLLSYIIRLFLTFKQYHHYFQATNHYLAGMPTSTYNPYFATGHLVPTLLGPDPSAVSQLGPVVQQTVVPAQQKIPRSDRLEVSVANFFPHILSTYQHN